MIYPPFCDICVVSTQSISRDIAEDAINDIFLKIKENIKEEFKDIKLIILGPSAASVAKVNNRYRFRMIIKCKNNSKFRLMLKKSLNIKLNNDVSVSVDFNPETII